MNRRVMPCILLVCALIALSGCGVTSSSQADLAATTSRLTSSGTAGAPLLPDPKLTPGATLDVTVADIRVPGYARKVRDVPVEVKRAVYAEYGITHHRPGEYEVDHLISLELGGSNSIKNLWPQSYVTQPWNAHVKDDLENKLHDLVCDGQVPLTTAQHDIATNWIAAYKEYFHTQQPLSGGYRRYHNRRESSDEAYDSAPVTTPAISASNTVTGQVWVNTHSGKYFFSDSPYYGHTKEGEYMTEAQAEQQGYVAARR